MERETLMNIHPKTIQEKLMWERLHNKSLLEENKSLKLENGMLNADIEELKYEMKNEEVGSLVLKVKHQLTEIKGLKDKLSRIKLENKKLLERLIQAQL